MRKFIERQGRNGELQMVIARNRFGGDGSRPHSQDFGPSRRAVEQRIAREVELESCGSDECDGSSRFADGRICQHTGAFVPAGGGTVRLDSDNGGRCPKLVFTEAGKLLSAHC